MPLHLQISASASFAQKISYAAFGLLLLAAAPLRADLLVLQPGGGGKGPGVVHRFDATTGAKLAVFGQANEGMRGMCVGPGGELFVGANTLGQCDVLRFDHAGQFRGSRASGFATEFIAMTLAADETMFGIVLEGDAVPLRYRVVRATAGAAPLTWIAPGAGGMTTPRALAVGPEGHLYVADAEQGVLRFHGSTGAFLDVFVPAGRGGLSDPARLIFDPAGRLYVASGRGNAVFRFDGATGAFVDTFVAAGSGGLRQPHGLAFGPNGDLFVSSRDTHEVLRFDGASGAFKSVFATSPDLRGPSWLVFTPELGLARRDTSAPRMAAGR